MKTICVCKSSAECFQLTLTFVVSQLDFLDLFVRSGAKNLDDGAFVRSCTLTYKKALEVDNLRV